MGRAISEEQARKVVKVLVDECGYRCFDPRDVESFVATVKTEDKPDRMHCREWRFMGALGFGGKFRNNGNNNNTPYVDCYQEDETPARLVMIEKANARLAEIFADALLSHRETKP